ncbi:hybrid sensor histidine kinase/response regulator (plasmid) [Azospirillum thermophilum]|uniref:histidine kinase n=2 Tax=Azospirillum thermophilum TaxID=2202148 RepID=A0A2S2CXV7_9PROT|nr:hybrid sensor histidine kinase/response regulator [Azospirillum thermophilum]
MRGHDWGRSPLGPPEGWPPALRTVVGLMLTSSFPMFVAWGAELAFLYNDGYRPIFGARHPTALGRPFAEVWSEIWTDISPLVDRALAGEATYHEDLPLVMERNGYPEETYFTFSYSPLRDEAGQVRGMFCACTETTEKVIAERRLRATEAELRAANARLAAEGEHLRELFRQAPGFMAVVRGPDHVFELANSAYQTLVGHRELMGRPVREAFPDLEGQGFFELLERVHRTGEPFVGHEQPLRIRRGPEGPEEERFLNFVYQPIRDRDGRVTGIFVEGSDVTEARRSAEALKASEERLRVAQEAGAIGTFELRGDGMLAVSETFCRLWGVPPRPLVPLRELAAMIHPEDRPRLTTLTPGAVPEDGLDYVEYRIRRPDTGETRWMARRGQAVRSGRDGGRRVLGVSYDITDRKRIEEELRELNATLECRVAERTADRDRMWRLSTDVMLVARFDGTVTAANPAWMVLLGWAERDLLGRSFLDLIHPDDLPATQAESARLAAGRTTRNFENRYRHKDGSYRWLSWIAVPDADLIHAVGRDVTAQKEADAALRQAQKMEAVGQLTGGVAHDFNNLLQVIGGNLQLLLRDIAGQERAEHRVRNALTAVSRGSKLASSLLAFARRQPLEPRAVDLGRLIRNLDDMIRRAIGEEIEIETISAAGLWNTLVDPTQVENALLNLAINARDAMNGRGRLTIETGNAVLDDEYALRHGDLRPGQYVMLAVTDTGCGMAPAVLDRVFEPFFTTKPEGQGTGLGLSMVYGFVKQSGGHVKIYSEPGQGTTIRLYLPRTHQEEDLAVELDSGPAGGGSETILVVEDDEEVRATVVEMLSDLGYRVLQARDAQSALVVLESGVPVDLLFTDVVMPGPLRSPDLARKARERLPDLAVLFTSGYTQNAIVHGGRLDAGVELLSKPYTREALARKVRHVLRNQAQQNAARHAAQARTPALPGVAGAGALRILLVEDEVLIRLATAEMLADLGHEVIEAGDAEEALSLAETEAVDLLMTDLTLPGLSGGELADRLRQRIPGLPVIFASGHDMEGGRSGRRPGGNTVHLQKPYDLMALSEALRVALRTV